MKMFSRFLLFMALSCCVCGSELNVDHSSYQAQEMENVTLGWTFTPEPQENIKNLTVICFAVKKKKVSVLLDFYQGVQVSQYQDKEFSGRVQFDEDKLKEGKIRVQLSSLTTEDSGRYTCEVYLFSERKSGSCRLTVTAARTQTLSTSEPGKNQIQTEPQEPDSGGPGRTALYWGLGLTAAAAAVGFMLFYFLIIHPRVKNRFTRAVESN